MPVLNDMRIPTPEGAREFEKITLAAVKIKWNNQNFSLNGRPGQKQNGVDIFGTISITMGIGIQCKNTTKNISQELILQEIKNAELFKPRLNVLYIATTLDYDSRLQETVRIISEKNKRDGLFDVAILFWDDIKNEITKDQSVLNQFYPQIFKINLQEEHDTRLINKTKEMLSIENTINFIKNHSFLTRRFDHKALNGLYYFMDMCDDPEFKFISDKLEMMRKTLCYNCTIFNGLIGHYHTTTLDDSSKLGADYYDYDYDEDRFKREAINKLEDAAINLYNSYCDLINPRSFY